MTKKKFSDIDDDAGLDLDFMMQIVKLEKTDKQKRHISPDLTPLFEELGRAHLQAVPVFQWLAGCTVKFSWQGELKYCRIVPPEGKHALIEHFISWLNNNRVGFHAMNAFGCAGVYVHRPRGQPWTYPESKKGVVPDALRRADEVIRDTADKVALQGMMKL